MKHLHIVLFLSLFFLGFGCQPSTQTSESDFQPAQGKATAVNGEDASKEGPYERRLQTAISYDGLTFVQNGGWISDQANVPDAVITQNGDIFLYYTGWMVGEKLNSSAVAISEDFGVSWTYHYLTVNDLPNNSSPVDPDVVLLEDGTFRLYFTSGTPDGKLGIYYAQSSDGLTFQYQGPIFTPRDDLALDSTTVKIGDTWHLWAMSKEGPAGLWHLTSTDGISFDLYAITSFPFNEQPYMVANGVWIDDAFHLFLFGPDGSIVSEWTKNGYDWYPDDGVRLSPSSEESYVKDPTMIPLPNGTYLMIYVTNTP